VDVPAVRGVPTLGCTAVASAVASKWDCRFVVAFGPELSYSGTGPSMRTTLVAVSLVVGASCGGKSEPAQEVMVGIGHAPEGIGECVDPAPATARAWAMGIDENEAGRVVVCRDDGEECRSIDVGTGAMSEHYIKIEGAEYDKPGAVVEDDGQLLVCWGQTSCKRRTPSAYETWMQAVIGDNATVAVLSSQTDKKFITTMDQGLTTTLRFEVAPGALDIVWRDDHFLVHAGDNGETHGYLYDGKGHAIGVVGKLGGKPAMDLGPGPVDLGKDGWGFLATDASVVAAYSLTGGEGTRVETGVTDIPAGLSDVSTAGPGKVAVALGGPRYGDVLIVDLAAAAVKPLVAKHCDEGAP